jgi:hypothetical protein
MEKPSAVDGFSISRKLRRNLDLPGNLTVSFPVGDLVDKQRVVSSWLYIAACIYRA